MNRQIEELEEDDDKKKYALQEWINEKEENIVAQDLSKLDESLSDTAMMFIDDQVKVQDSQSLTCSGLNVFTHCCCMKWKTLINVNSTSDIPCTLK